MQSLSVVNPVIVLPSLSLEKLDFIHQHKLNIHYKRILNKRKDAIKKKHITLMQDAIYIN